MVESIKELRRICQATRDTELFQDNWFDRNLYRPVSIYFTKLFLKIGISANQATLLSFFIGIAAGAFFTFAEPAYWFIGLLLFYLYFVFDCVDGELARYYKSESAIGLFLDNIVGWFIWPYTFACMTFGIYSTVHSLIVFVFGFLVVICWLVYMVLGLLPYYVLHEKGLLHGAIEAPIAKESGIMRYGRIIFGLRGFMPAMVMVAVIDCFVSPVTIGPATVNARFAYLIIFGLAALGGLVIAMYNVIRHGIKLQKS